MKHTLAVLFLLSLAAPALAEGPVNLDRAINPAVLGTPVGMPVTAGKLEFRSPALQREISHGLVTIDQAVIPQNQAASELVLVDIANGKKALIPAMSSEEQYLLLNLGNEKR